MQYHDDQVWMFTNYGSLALIFPFIVLFYKQIQMSESTIGMLSGLRPCLTAVFGEEWNRSGTGTHWVYIFTCGCGHIPVYDTHTGNMWAIIADRTGTHRIILVAGAWLCVYPGNKAVVRSSPHQSHHTH